MEQLKRGFAVFTAMMILLHVFTIPIYAQDEIKVVLNGNRIKFDVQPQIIDNRTMVPMRAIFSALDAEVSWNQDNQSIVATKEDMTIEMTIGRKAIYTDGVKKDMDVAPIIISSRALVPVRVIAESFDCEVKWDERTSAVYIYSDEKDNDSWGNDIQFWD